MANKKVKSAKEKAKKVNKESRSKLLERYNKTHFYIVLAILVLLSITIIVINNLKTCDNCVKEDGTGEEINQNVKREVNLNEGITKDREVEGFLITNNYLYTETLDDKTVSSKFTAIVNNNTGSDKEVKSFDIIFKDKDGKEIITLLGYVGQTIPNGESRSIESNVDIGLLDAYIIEYKLNK